MLTIRFSRVGKKKAPVYRIVVQAKHRDPWSPAVEILGHYNPLKTPKEFVIKEDRTKYWIGQGAQPSDTVWNLLVENKIVEGEKRSTTHISKKHTGRIEQKATEAKAKADEVAAKAQAAKEATKEPAA
ncbi:30S ribosomal protein S16 [Candidatus Uhrbacteria bacterium]|nr:30S ribosomal protein S16 [Candidatus Uhrbacteria bacterium]